MLAKRIIPCLDVRNGRVVKGVQFVNLRDAGDPVESAAHYDRSGADEITFLDITASHEGRKAFVDVIHRTAEKIRVPLTVGGGVSELGDIEQLLDAGADKISINTAAVKNPRFVEEAAQSYGSQAIVVAIDVKRVSGGSREPRWEVFTHGGRQSTGLEAVAWAKQITECGAGEILLTSMDRDGTQQGYDVAIIRKISERVSVPVIASGGVGTLEHFCDGFVRGGADAALAASVFHDGRFTVTQVKEYLQNEDVCVRLIESYGDNPSAAA